MRNRMPELARLDQKIVNAGKGRTIGTTLVSYELAETANVARVIVVHSDVLTASEKDIAESISERFKHQASWVEGTMKNIGKYNGRTYVSGLMGQNIISKEYDVSKMTVIASDMFIDESDENRIWRAVGSGDTKRLILNNDDDFEELLASRRKVYMVPEQASNIEAQNGDYAMAYSPFNDDMIFGYVIKTTSDTFLFDRKSEETIKLDPVLTLQSVVINDPEKNGMKAVANAIGEASMRMPASRINAILDYYRKLYKGTVYFTNLEETLRRHRG